MFRGIVDTVIGNLRLSITNVHIRYEVLLLHACIIFAYTGSCVDSSTKCMRSLAACMKLNV